VFSRLINRNTTIPTKKSQIFSTSVDGQTSVEIKIGQGERELIRDNKILGTFQLRGILPAPKGVPQIEVTFDIDADGIVNVSAQDKATGKDQSITLAASSGLNKSEIERMIIESERYADADREKREIIETSNHADSVIHETEKNMKEYKDQLDQTESENIKSQIQSLKEIVAKAQTGESTFKADEIKSKVGELQIASLKLFEMVYKKREAENRGNNSSNENGGANEVEYRDVKGDNKE